MSGGASIGKGRGGVRAAARGWLVALAALNAFVVDQLVKKLAIAQWRDPPTSTAVVPGYFDLCYVENRGAAFGIFQDNVVPLAVFSVVAFAFLAWRRKELFGASRTGAAAETLLYAGLFGNLYDRLARGCVVDMFHFHLKDAWSFPVFNVADVYITIAAFFLVLAMIFSPEGKAGGKDDKA